MDITTLLFAEPASEFVLNVFPVVRTILLILIAVCCVVMIITTLLQSSANPAGSSAVTGTNESYFSQNRDNSRDGRLKRITITMASIIAVSIVLYFCTGFFLGFPS